MVDEIDDFPSVEELNPDEWKLLFMMLVENRGNIDFNSHLTAYGQYILSGLKRVVAINVVGIDGETEQPKPFNSCENCHQPLTMAN